MEKIDYAKQSEILKALSHPLRLKILKVLSNNEICVNNLSVSLKISQSTSSHHLTILRNSGIIRSHKKGAKVFYAIKNDLAKEIISILPSEN